MDDGTSEQVFRREAIRRRLEGQQRCMICQDLGRSPSWFSKWWGEYQRHPQTDFADGSRAPLTSPHQTPPHVERAIVNIRHTLEAARTPETRYGFVGHRAIQAELERQRIQPLPSLATIQRILARHHLTQTDGAHSSVSYPELKAWAPSAVQATDIITRHLRGGEVIQNFHTVDHYSHAVHLSQHHDKSATTAGAHLLDTWADLGLPYLAQFDNEDCFKGGHTHPRVLGQVVRLCLFVGAEVLFLPEYEPERNYWVEGFHSLWLTGFWSKRRFRNLAHVRMEAPLFRDWYHMRYMPPSLDGRTPAQMRKGFHPIRLTAALRRLIPERLPITAGYVHFLRQVDAAGEIRLLNEAWSVGERWSGEYVWATVNTVGQTLDLWYQKDAQAAWQRIKTRRYRLPEPVQPLRAEFRRNCPRCREQWPH